MISFSMKCLYLMREALRCQQRGHHRSSEVHDHVPDEGCTQTAIRRPQTHSDAIERHSGALRGNPGQSASLRALLDLLQRKLEKLYLANELHVFECLNLVTFRSMDHHHLAVVQVRDLLRALHDRGRIRCEDVPDEGGTQRSSEKSSEVIKRGGQVTDDGGNRRPSERSSGVIKRGGQVTDDGGNWRSSERSSGAIKRGGQVTDDGGNRRSSERSSGVIKRGGQVPDDGGTQRVISANQRPSQMHSESR